jgi:2'-hydroxyisoflavone reductase
MNATGPAEPLTMEQLLEECRTATGSNARLVWVGEEFLVENGVEAWSDLPMWLAPTTRPESAGFLAMDASRAQAVGLRFRPLAQTIEETLRGAVPTEDAGLTSQRERELLASWRALTRAS